MPYVDIHSKDDYASIFYRTSATYSNVGGFDPEKPTIMILHPLLLDSSWLECQFGDPRLYSNYNLIAFDMRSCGRSRCKPSAKHDSWVDAADIAFCHQVLHLPPCHVFALEGVSVNCALRFSLLFPEMCLSLALCNVPAPIEERWTYNALEEVMHSWCFAEDLESVEHAATEAITLFFGADCDPDLQDEIVAHWEKNMPPQHRPWVAETIGVLLHRTSLTPDVFAEIAHPVLIIHGERSEICPKKHAEKLAAQLISVENGAVIYTVRGAGGFLSVVPGSASIANQVLAKFLCRMPPSRSDLIPPALPIHERMKGALKRQAELIGNKDITSLEPMCSLSFSCLSEAVVKSRTELLEQYTKGRSRAFNPLGPDGRPPRKLSEAKNEHWFQSGRDGLSVAATNFLPPERGKQDQDKSGREGQVTKSSFTPATVEKYYIHPIAKVVRDTPAAPLGRLLMQ